ncbi:MAG: hypothetical protein CMP68_02785 [Flavobacteriales bacterium]|nr:hypothetical protein [Flavobacteriales bacterium]|tara:strand:+ start:3653 stop:4333 length:681 start_codon:yes stop_codon:yes gene_type:complete
MKKIKFILFIITLLTFQKINSQTLKTQNLPKYDKQWYHFGFTLGLMNTNLKIDFQDFSTANKIYSSSSPGFNVGIICDLKLSKNLNVRVIPSLTFTQRDVYIQMTNEDQIMKSVENSNLDVPILFKYRSIRYQNVRPFLLIGPRFTYDMASKKDVDDINLFKLNNIDYGLEFGFGLDIYLPYFKLAPEIKYFYGFNNLLEDNNNDLIISNIEALYSRTILFSLTFE